MATLFNTKISNTYPSLIKSLDNAAIGATLKELSDGSGNALGIKVNTAGDFLVPATLSFGSLKDIGENITITKFVDAADGITNNNNDTSIPTSKAVKDFVEAHVTAQDLDFTDGTNSGAVDLDSQSLAIIGTANEIETAASGQQLQIGIPTNPTLSGNVTITGDLNISQGEIINIGSNFDLYATASGEYIQYGSNPVIFNGNADVIFRKQGSEEKTAVFTPQGAAELYFNNTKRLETLTGGAKVTGDLTVTGSITGSGGSFLPLAGGTMTGSTIHNDNVKSIYGTSSDGLEIYHDSSHSYLKDSGTGELKILSSSVAIQSASGGEYIAYFAGTGGQTASLYAGNVKKLETSATGITVTGSVTGNLIGNVTGNVTGNITGTVNASSVLADGVTATTQADSDDSTKVATTAFVKSLNNASDLDFSGDSGTGDVTLNSQTFSVIGTANEVETSASNQQLQIGLPSSINVNSASATILQTARDISLTGEASATISSFNGSSDVSGAVTLDNNSVTGKVLTGLASPTASNILASDTILEAFGKTQSQLNTLAGGLRFMGTWNANTNTPTLQSGGGEADSGTTTGTATNKLIQSGQNFTSTVTNGDKVINQASGATALVTNVDSNTQLTLDADIMVSGQEYTIDNSPFITQGHYFVVSVGGTSSLNGLSNWAVGDWVIAGAGNVWEKLDHTQVDGTGTAGKIAKFSSTNVIADSIMSESGSTVTTTGINKSTSDTYVLGSLGVGTESPSRPLSVHKSSAGSIANFLHYTDASNFSGMYISADQSTDVVTLNASGSSGATWNFQCGNTQAMTLSATLMDVTGDVKLDSKLIFDYGGDHYLQSGTNSLAYKTSGGTSVVSFNATTLASTFAGDVTISGAEYVNQIQARTSAGLKLGNDDNSGFVFVADNGQINLDSGNSEIHLKGGGTTFGKVFKSSDNLYINNPIQDKDIIFSGDDGGSSVTALTLDMSDSGFAIFNYGVKAPFFTSDGGRGFKQDGVAFVSTYSNGSDADAANDLGTSTNRWRDLYLHGDIEATDSLTIDVTGDLSLDASGNDIRFKVNGTEYGKFKQDSSNFAIYSSVENKDIIFRGNDGGTTIDALRLDMSNGGSATFLDDIDLAGNINLTGTSKVIRLNNGGYIDFDSTNLQFNTQRDPNTGGFHNTAKSHAHIGLQGANGGSQIIFGTAAANNTVATTRLTIDSTGTIKGTGTYTAGNSIKIFEAERSGGAVKSDWSYHDSNTTMSFGTSTNHSLNLKTNDTVRIRVQNNGNIGVGTENPQNLFCVANGTDNTQNVEIAPNYIQSFNRQSGNLGYASLDFYASSYQFNQGNLGIGVTPIAKFHVKDSSSAFTLQDYSGNAALFLDGANGDFTGGDYFHIDASADRMGLGGYGGGAPKLQIDTVGTSHIMGASASLTNSLQLKYNSTSGEASIGPRSSGGSTFVTFQTADSGTVADRLKILSGGNTQVLGDTLLINPSSGGNAMLEVTRTSGANVFIQSQSSAGVLGVATNNDLDFKTNDTTRAKISNNGYFKQIGLGASASIIQDAKLFNATNNNGSSGTNTDVEFDLDDYDIGTSGYYDIVISASGYGSGGSAGFNYSYQIGGYSGHTENATYHKVTNITSNDSSCQVSVRNPSADKVGIRVFNQTAGNQTIVGVIRITITTSY